MIEQPLLAKEVHLTIDEWLEMGFSNDDICIWMPDVSTVYVREDFETALAERVRKFKREHDKYGYIGRSTEPNGKQ